jgi:hypothetical protein
LVGNSSSWDEDEVAAPAPTGDIAYDGDAAIKDLRSGGKFHRIWREDCLRAAALRGHGRPHLCRLRMLMKKRLCFMTDILYDHSILGDL